MSKLEESARSPCSKAPTGKVDHRPLQSDRVQLRAQPTPTRRRRSPGSARRSSSSSMAKRPAQHGAVPRRLHRSRGPASLRAATRSRCMSALKDIASLLEIDPRSARAPAGALQLGAAGFRGGHREARPQNSRCSIPDGTPARATLSVTFKEYRTLRQQLEDPRASPGRQDKRRVVVGRDSSGCSPPREYDDPARGYGSPTPTISTTRARSRPATGWSCRRSRIRRWNSRRSLDATAISTRPPSPCASDART